MKKNHILIFFLVLFCSQFLISQSVPIANNDTYTTFVNTSLNVPASGILENDTDANKDFLKVIQFLINGVAYTANQTAVFDHGTMNILEDGSFNFTPVVDFVGDVDTITYTITDGTFQRSANLNITVIFPPSPPEANNDSYTAFLNEPLQIQAAGILDNDTDINADILKVKEFSINGATLTAGQQATFAQGSLIIFENGSFTYNPLDDFVGGTDTITYTITDGVFTNSASIPFL